MVSIKNLNTSHSGCCALAEIINIQAVNNPFVCALEAAKSFASQKCGAYFFTQNTNSNAGEELATFVTESKLGLITKVEPFTNHRYGFRDRFITMWVWTIDAEAIQVFWEKNKPEALVATTTKVEQNGYQIF